MNENEASSHDLSAANGRKSANVKQSAETPLAAAPAQAGEPAREIEAHRENSRRSLRPAPVLARTPRKPTRRYEPFGETIRYLTFDEWRQLLDGVDDYRHALMFRLIYHLGCRVGEFVRIQLKHLDFNRNSVFIPAENTKTGHRRTSHVPRGLMNEIKSLLRREGRMLKRSETVGNPEHYLFHYPGRAMTPYTENRIRQIFQKYVRKAGLSRVYGADSKGRKLHRSLSTACATVISCTIYTTTNCRCPLSRNRSGTAP